MTNLENHGIFVTSAVREKCPYSELFWSAFSRVQTKYGEILKIRTRITPNTDSFYAVLCIRSNY